MVPSVVPPQQHRVRCARTILLRPAGPVLFSYRSRSHPAAETKALKEDDGEGFARVSLCRTHSSACNSGTASGMRAGAVLLVLQDVSSPSAQTAVLAAPTVQSGRLCNSLISKKSAGAHSSLSHTSDDQVLTAAAPFCSTLDTTRFGVTSFVATHSSMQSASYKSSHLPIATLPHCGTHSRL